MRSCLIYIAQVVIREIKANMVSQEITVFGASDELNLT